MIHLGLSEETRGYFTALNEFERQGKPLTPRMARALEGEVERAEKFCKRLRKAIDGSEVPVKPRKRRAKA